MGASCSSKRSLNTVDSKQKSEKTNSLEDSAFSPIETVTSLQTQVGTDGPFKISPSKGNLIYKSVLSPSNVLQNIRDKYTFVQVLGKGNLSTVRLAEDKVSGEKVAVKSISKKKISNNQSSLKRELRILRMVEHPNIVEFIKTYEDDRYFHIVMEYSEGENLYEKVSNTTLPEPEVRIIMNKLFAAVQYLHDQNIAHRDLKLENIMLTKNGQLKIVGFGQSNRFSKQNHFETIVGSPHYIAPEVLGKKYTTKCDCWSLGVMMYVLLSGYPPFRAKHHATIYDKIQKEDPSFQSSDWDNISKEAKLLILKLLIKDPEERIDCKEAMQQQWFNRRASIDAQMLKMETEGARRNSGLKLYC